MSVELTLISSLDIVPEEQRPPASDFKIEQLPYQAKRSDMVQQPDSDLSNYRAANKLDGKRALSTGGASGIGRAVAIAFAMEGADVAIAYNTNDDEAADTCRHVEAHGRRCVRIKADVRQSEKCREAVHRTADELGGLNVLVNNAAYQMSQPSFLDISEEQLRRTFETNIFG